MASLRFYHDNLESIRRVLTTICRYTSQDERAMIIARRKTNKASLSLMTEAAPRGTLPIDPMTSLNHKPPRRVIVTKPRTRTGRIKKSGNKKNDTPEQALDDMNVKKSSQVLITRQRQNIKRLDVLEEIRNLLKTHFPPEDALVQSLQTTVDKVSKSIRSVLDAISDQFDVAVNELAPQEFSIYVNRINAWIDSLDFDYGDKTLRSMTHTVPNVGMAFAREIHISKLKLNRMTTNHFIYIIAQPVGSRHKYHVMAANRAMDFNDIIAEGWGETFQRAEGAINILRGVFNFDERSENKKKQERGPLRVRFGGPEPVPPAINPESVRELIPSALNDDRFKIQVKFDANAFADKKAEDDAFAKAFIGIKKWVTSFGGKTFKLAHGKSRAESSKKGDKTFSTFVFVMQRLDKMPISDTALLALMKTIGADAPTTNSALFRKFKEASR